MQWCAGIILTVSAWWALSLFPAEAAVLEAAPAETQVGARSRQAFARGALASEVDRLMHLVLPGSDEFASEQCARALAERFQRFSAQLLREPSQLAELSSMLGSEVESTGLKPAREVQVGNPPSLLVFQDEFGPEMRLPREHFIKEWRKFVSPFSKFLVCDFHLLSITCSEPVIETAIRYEFSGIDGSGALLEVNGVWDLIWRQEGDVWKIRRWRARNQTRSWIQRAAFQDVTSAALGDNSSYLSQLVPGIDSWRAVLDAAVGLDVYGNNGISVADVDGDGLEDFYVCQPSGLPNRLFRNRGDGTFLDITKESGLAVLDSTTSALFCDYDNDDDQDVIVVTWRKPLLFLNDGRGHFSFQKDAFRQAEEPKGALVGGSVADYDRDGYLDLYVNAYSYFLGEGAYRLAVPYHDSKNGPPNYLFRNRGDGSFEDVTRQTGLDRNNHHFSFASAWVDYDRDGWQDLYVANDFGRNNLYRNNGPSALGVTFTDSAEESGVVDIAAGMSVSWLDYNNDGWLDLYVGNMWSPAGMRIAGQPEFQPHGSAEVQGLYRRHARGNSLFRNRGDGTFEEVSLISRAELGRWAWSSDYLDFDNDGWLDLYIANGFVSNTDREDLCSFFWRQVVARSPLEPVTGRAYEDGWRTINRLIRAQGTWAGYQRNVFLRNGGNGTFADISAATGLDFREDGRAFAVFDFDLDGDPDIALKARTGPQLRLMRNDFPSAGSWLALRLVGTKSNRDAVGATVTIETKHLRQARALQAGSGFISQHSKELLFGLGPEPGVSRIVIVWPSGLRQEFEGVAGNQRIRIEEGEEKYERVSVSAVQEKPAPLRQDLAVNIHPSEMHSETWLYEPYPAPDFALSDSRKKVHRLRDYLGRNVLLHFWSAETTEHLQKLLRSFRQSKNPGSVLLAIPADGSTEVLSEAETGSSFVILDGDRSVLQLYDVCTANLFDRRRSLEAPTTLLLDREGFIVKIYRGAIKPEQLTADLVQIWAYGEERLKRSLPFDGHFYFLPPGRNHFEMGILFAEAGFIDPALSAFEKSIQANPGFADAHYNLGTLHMVQGEAEQARRSLERALQFKADYPEAHNNLGILLAQGGRWSEALGHFKSAVAARPEYHEALNNLGWALMQSGQPREALRVLRKSLQLKPDYPEALNNLGTFYGQQGDLVRARESFEKALELRPDYSEAANNLGIVFIMTGQIGRAERILEESLRGDPAFQLTYLTLARAKLAAGKKEDAVQVLEDLLRRDPQNREAARAILELRGRRP